MRGYTDLSAICLIYFWIFSHLMHLFSLKLCYDMEYVGILNKGVFAFE